VAVHYHGSASGAEQTARAIRGAGRRAELLQADLNDPQAARGLADQAARVLKRLDVLVNSAAIMVRQPVEEVTPESWDATLDLNLRATFFVSQGAIPDTIVLLEHPPVVTLGRRTDETAEVHVPEGAEVEVVETDRGGKSTFHGPGQLVCYPILDLKRHGRDVKQYVRNLEEALIGTLASLGLEGTRLEGLTGVWLQRPPRKVASIGVHVSRWVTTHGYALNVDLDPTPFTDWITACGLEDAMFTTIARELGRPVTVDEVRPHAVAALEDVFGLELEELPANDGAGLWPQPLHAQLAAKA